MDNLLFDRFVNLKLTYNETFDTDKEIPSIRTISVLTPKQGRKPDIHITGSVLPTQVVTSMNVRLINFYSSIPLAAYTNIEVEAGYFNGPKTSISGSVNGIIPGGGIGWAYQESPSPDGITNFSLMMGQYDSWMNKKGSIDYGEGSTVGSIFTQACSVMGLTPRFGDGVENLAWSAKGSYQGPLKDKLEEIATAKSLVLQLNGSELRCYFSKAGIGASSPKKITYMSSPPKIEMPGQISFVCPWRPDVITGDVIEIEPRYAKQTFGGSLGRNVSLYTVLNYDFDFSTIDTQNSMRVTALVAIDAESAKKELGL